ncbi:MAG: hypothetical protein FJX76_06860 [Armatimonadetes bacterium]|nr:hypothetical protein [Armatimonadota bacterium]
MTLAVPSESDALLATPALSEYSGMMAAAREAVAGWRFSVAGTAAGEWRSAARQELSGLAGGGAVTGNLLVTGHQPDLYHPGVWVKNFIVDAVCRAENIPGLNLIVDSDLAGAVVPLPRRDGRMHVEPLRVPGARAGIPWEALPPLRPSDWQGLLDQAESAIGTLHSEEAAAALQVFRTAIFSSERVAAAGSLAGSLAWARRAYEGEPAYLELEVSRMSGSLAFRRFVSEVLLRLEDFWHAYNDSLAGYRARHRIRTRANPVPDLKQRDALWETPFWYLHEDGQRKGLFAEREGTGWTLKSRDDVFVHLDGDPTSWPERLEGLSRRIRPRALTLTMFIRLAAADLFVHGIGGARYDRVTDHIVEQFFGIAPPPYCAASITMRLPFCPEGHGESVRDLRRGLRDLRWNPQRVARGPEAARLAKTKMELIAGLDGSTQKARLTRDIRALNERMWQTLDGKAADLRARLQAAEAAEDERRVACSREYPYFLFPVERMRAALVNNL